MATLKNSISLRLKGDQPLKLAYLSRRNHDAKQAQLIRTGIEILARVAELNGGLVPLLEQILIRRAARDRRRSR